MEHDEIVNLKQAPSIFVYSQILSRVIVPSPLMQIRKSRTAAAPRIQALCRNMGA
jgi:hypothetical protein